MRKAVIECEVCSDSARWVVFGSVLICDHCRLRVIDCMRSMGFSLATTHPFTDEFIEVSGPAIHCRLEKFSTGSA